MQRKIPFLLIVLTLFFTHVGWAQAPVPKTSAEAYEDFLRVKEEIRGKPDRLNPQDRHRWAQALLFTLLLTGTNSRGELPEEDFLALIDEAMPYGPELIVRATYRSNEWIKENWKKVKKGRKVRLSRLDSAEKQREVARFIAEVRFWDYFIQRKVDILIKYDERRKALDTNEKAELEQVNAEMQSMWKTFEKLGADQMETGWLELVSERKKELEAETAALDQHLESILRDFDTYVTKWRDRINDMEIYSAAWQRAYQEYKEHAEDVMSQKVAIEDQIRKHRAELNRLDAWLSVSH